VLKKISIYTLEWGCQPGRVGQGPFVGLSFRWWYDEIRWATV